MVKLPSFGSWNDDWTRRAKSAAAVIISFVILIGGTVFVSSKVYGAYMDWRQTDDYIGDGDEDIQIVIPAGATIGQIADILVQADVIRSAKTFESVASDDSRGSAIQPGRYNIKTELPAEMALDYLSDPANRVINRVTITEGLRWTEIVPILAQASGLPEDDFLAILNDPTQVAELGLNEAAQGQVEGFLFPDTYDIAEPPSAAEMLRRMASQFNKVATEINLANGFIDTAHGDRTYDARTLVIVASIIEKEVFIPEDRPKVARVIYNRLAQDPPMKLQTDSTVNYGLNRTGQANLEDGDTEKDTPYNTYMHDGLPPTPISNPGRDALAAAMNPADGDWLYWVTVNLDTGETKFSSTAEEHEANVEVYKEWCRNSDTCE
jgi:UPF0755 protein